MVSSSSSTPTKERTGYPHTAADEARQSEEEESISPFTSETCQIGSSARMSFSTLIVLDDGDLSESTEVQLDPSRQDNTESPPVSPGKSKSSRHQEGAVSPKPNAGSCQRRGRFLIWPASPASPTGLVRGSRSSLEVRNAGYTISSKVDNF